MKDWQTKIRTSRIGDKVPLTSVKGFWVKPRKFSVEENDRIQEAQLKALKSVNKGTLARATQKIQAASQNSENVTMIEILSDEDVETLMDAKFAPSSEILKLYILFGIVEHNFCEEESSTKVDEALVLDLLKYPDIATEIGSIVREYNTPLAERTFPISGTSHDGSIKEQNSK